MKLRMRSRIRIKKVSKMLNPDPGKEMNTDTCYLYLHDGTLL
jgi:hypothetical protein